MKILNIGSMNIDYAYNVNDIVKPGETISAFSLMQNAGGKGLNQSIAAKRAGVDVYHACMVGKGGDALTDFLKECDVNTDYIKQTDENQGHAVIQVDNRGANSIIVYGGSNQKITKPYIDEVLMHFDKDDFLMLQNEVSELEHIIDSAHEKGLNIVLNASPVDDALLKIDFNKLYCLVINEAEAQAIANTPDLERAVFILNNKYPDVRILLTMGVEGSIYMHKKQKIRQKSYKVKTVDTTAAGDTFTGYFVACLSKGYTIEQSLDIASMAAAVTVTKKGAATSIPKMKQVLRALDEYNVGNI